jgi:hypothetical protein
MISMSLKQTKSSVACIFGKKVLRPREQQFFGGERRGMGWIDGPGTVYDQISPACKNRISLLLINWPIANPAHIKDWEVHGGITDKGPPIREEHRNRIIVSLLLPVLLLPG